MGCKLTDGEPTYVSLLLEKQRTLSFTRRSITNSSRGTETFSHNVHSLCYAVAKMSAPKVDAEENRRKMAAGELYYAFTPELVGDRQRCKQAMRLYNESDGLSRREQIELYQE